MRRTHRPATSHLTQRHPLAKPCGDMVGVPPANGKKRQRAKVGRRKSDPHNGQTLKVFNEDDTVFLWDEDARPAENYACLGERLAAIGDLFRSPQYGSGLILLLPNGKPVQIEKGDALLPVIIDRVPVQIVRDGKPKGGRIPAAHLNAMLKSESFLSSFRTVDRISTHPVCLADWSITKPGFNEGEEGHRIFFTGKSIEPSTSLDTINKFLDVMEFDSEADRTNTVAAALTVLGRDHWPGGKPVILATATKSHAGKDTVIAFASGLAGKVSISYDSTDWALQRSFVEIVKDAPDAGVIVVENARLYGRQRQIASGFLERFATDEEPVLFSPGSGHPIHRGKNLVLAISTNFGVVSEDLMNRSLPIRLAPQGDVADRKPLIGNPKYKFLPENREKITGELLGMIERWKREGRPLDEEVQHSFSPWAETIGGILKVNGFEGFLGNYRIRRILDDPIKNGLAILGAARPGEWLRPGAWAEVMAQVGLTKTLIQSHERDSNAGCTRALGVLLSAHDNESFEVETESHRLRLKLKRKRGRFGGEPHIRYCFEELERVALAVEGDQEGLD